MNLKRTLHTYDSSALLRVSLHGLFWLVLLAVQIVLTRSSLNVYSSFPFATLLLLNFSATLCMAGFYYVLVYALFPKILLKGRILLGLALALVLYAFYVLADASGEVLFMHTCRDCMAALEKTNPVYTRLLNLAIGTVIWGKLFELRGIALLAFVLCIPLTIKIAVLALRRQIKSLELEKDNLQLEINFLKAQLNPHFLFNSMNNIYSMIINGEQERSAGLVARLSGLLRYILYESNQETMPLEKEVGLLRDYIELEKVRLNDTRVSFNVRGEPAGKRIAPLLLLPLVENAFKFSADEPGAFIDIRLELTAQGLRLHLDNMIDADRQLGETGGIGLVNFSKRLELYYAGRYTYQASAAGNIYNVNLMISL
jgi:hypothetical protein